MTTLTTKADVLKYLQADDEHLNSSFLYHHHHIMKTTQKKKVLKN